MHSEWLPQRIHERHLVLSFHATQKGVARFREKLRPHLAVDFVVITPGQNSLHGRRLLGKLLIHSGLPSGRILIAQQKNIAPLLSKCIVFDKAVPHFSTPVGADLLALSFIGTGSDCRREHDRPVSMIFFGSFRFLPTPVETAGFDIEFFQLVVIGSATHVMGNYRVPRIRRGPGVCFHESHRGSPMILGGFVEFAPLDHHLPEVCQGSS